MLKIAKFTDIKTFSFCIKALFVLAAVAPVAGAFTFAVAPAPAQAVTANITEPIWSQVGCSEQSATSCNYCNLITLIGVISQFMVYIGTALAALAFAYAGFLYMTAPLSGSGNIAKAHDIFSTVVFGIVIMLVAYLIINLILATLAGGGAGAGSWFLGGPWNAPACSTPGT